VESGAGAEEPAKYYYFYFNRIIIATNILIHSKFRRKPDRHGGFRGHFSDTFKYQLTLSILYTLKLKNQGDFMGTKIGKEKIKREPGYLYYLGKDGFVWAAPMKNNKGGKKKKVGTEKIAREKGFLYYLGKDGFVGKAKMKNA